MHRNVISSDFDLDLYNCPFVVPYYPVDEDYSLAIIMDCEYKLIYTSDYSNMRGIGRLYSEFEIKDNGFSNIII